MGSRDKKAEEIVEETMKEFFDDLNQSKSFREMDGSNDISRKKSSGKKNSKGSSGRKAPEREGRPRRKEPQDSVHEKALARRRPGQEEQKGGRPQREASQRDVPQRETSQRNVSPGEVLPENVPHKKKTRRKDAHRASVSAGGDVSGAAGQKDAEEFLDGHRKKTRHNREEKLGGRDLEPYEETEDFGGFDDWEEDRMEKKSRKKKKDRNQKAGKTALIAAGSVAGVLLATYIGLSMFFNSHFMFFTKINGTDCSLKSVEQVEDGMKKKVEDYTLTLEGSDGKKETIDGSGISLEYVPGEKLNEIAEEQNGFLWPKSLWDHPEIETEIGVRYDEAALGEAIAALGCMNPETQTPSVDAHPEFQEGQFVVVPEVVGTQINGEVFSQKVAEAINGFRPTMDLSEAGCYMPPRFVADSPEVTAAAAAMNSYLGANVTYDMNPDTEVVDASVISQWIRVDGDMNVTFDEEAVRAYVQSLADKYNTKGVPRQFTTAGGNVVTVEGGGFGWRIDQDAEYAALTANIQNAETVTREPAYSSRGISHGGSDVGGTYAEVDLTNQKMYFIKDGQVILQSDCVTGNPNKGHATPQGVYSLAWKQKNRTLRGEKQPDGTYEYETPVAFWMPFNGGIGFHDATWQSSFGGRRYQTHGSHGCVNLPYSIAKQLYDLMYDGVPVVCHY